MFAQAAAAGFPTYAAGSPKGKALEVFPHATRGGAGGGLAPKGTQEARVAERRAARPGRADRRAVLTRPGRRRARGAHRAAGARRQAVRAGRPDARASSWCPSASLPAAPYRPGPGRPRTRSRCSTTAPAAMPACDQLVRGEFAPGHDAKRKAMLWTRAREGADAVDELEPGMEAATGDAMTARGAHRARDRPTARRGAPRGAHERRHLPVRDPRDPRGPGPRRPVRGGQRPDLPDLDLRAAGGRRAEGVGLRARRQPHARGVPAGARRARGRASAGSRSRAGSAPRPRCCSRCGPATTWCSPTTCTAAPTGCCRRCSRRWGLTFTTVDLGDQAALVDAIGPTTKLVWIETPSNPLLKIVDIGAVAATAHDAGARVVVDNTFATPALQRPLSSGRRRRRAQRHEVPRRPLRPDRRRDRHERRGVDRTARVPRRTRSARCPGRWTATSRCEA